MHTKAPAELCAECGILLATEPARDGQGRRCYPCANWPRGMTTTRAFKRRCRAFDAAFNSAADLN